MVHPDVIQCESSHCACGWLSPGGIVSGFRGSGNVQCGSSMVVGLGFALRKAGRQAGKKTKRVKRWRGSQGNLRQAKSWATDSLH